LNYIKEKYGDKASAISINTTMKVKATIRDIERLELGHVRESTELMCRNLPNITTGTDNLQWLNGYIDKETDEWKPGFLEDKSDEAEALRTYVSESPELWSKILQTLGIVRQKSVHACGHLIAGESLQNLIPMMMSKDGLMSGFDPKSVEYAGMVKFDILGVTTLESMKISIDSIKQHHGVDLGWDEFPATEEDYVKVVGKGLMAGIFQLKTNTMRPYVAKIQPRCADDCSNVCAVIRPGTLAAPAPNPNFKGTAADYFVAIRQGKEKPYYIHKDLEPILGRTLGVLLMQEQTLKIFRDLAGYTYGQAEKIRRGIGKKNKQLIEEGLKDLRAALGKRGWTDEQITCLYDTIMASSKYSFNLAHSASYGVVANNGIFLKSRYPLHFYLGELAVNGGDNEKLEPLVNECAHLLLPADIKKSHATEWVIEGDKLRAPLSISKGVGGRTPADLQQILTFGLDSFKVKNNESIVDQPLDGDEGSL
jgi:DNA polymerase-3 subunit alpha